MRPLYASTALALLFGLAASADAAGTDTGQSASQQAAPSEEQHSKQIRPTDQQAKRQPSGTGQDGQTQALRSIDANQDGRISAEETQAHRERLFSRLDANSDGRLSRQEIGGLTAIEPGYVVITRMIPVALASDVGSQMLSEMDQDQNRQVSRQEYMHYGEQQFTKAQEQAGGELNATRAEKSQTQQARGETQQTQPGQTERGQGETTGWQNVVRWREAEVDRNSDDIIGSDEAASVWSQTFNELDRNGDNQLSQDELDQVQAQKAMIDKRFEAIDGNGDGQVSEDEFTNVGANLMQRADLNEDGDVTAWEYRALRVTDL